MQKLFLEYSEKLRKTIFGSYFEYQAKSEQCKTYNTHNEHTSSLFTRGTGIVKSMIVRAFVFLRLDIFFEKVQASELHVYGTSTSSREQSTKLSIQEHMKNVAIIENLQREVKSNCRLIDGLKMKVQSQRGELKEKTTKLANLEVENLTKKMQVCCLQSTNDTLTMMIDDLKQKIKDLEEQVAILNDDISKKNIEVARLLCEAENRPQHLETKTAQVLSLTADFMDKNDQSAELKDSIERVTVGNPKAGKKVEELASSVKANQKMLVSERDCELATLRLEAHEKEQELQKRSSRISDLENTIKLKDLLIDTLQVDDQPGSL